MDANFNLSTIEDLLMFDIDKLCSKFDIDDDARNSYSNAYLRAVGRFMFDHLDHLDLDKLPKTIYGTEFEDQKHLNNVRDTLLTPLVPKTGCVKGFKVARQILTCNLVMSFLKAITEKQIISTQKRAIHPSLRGRKKNKKSNRTNNYSYITIDSETLTSLKRERRNTVRKSERYQTQVADTMGFRWVREGTPQGLREDEDIYDIVENISTGIIKYKVKRPIQGYTRNAHLPKRAESENPTPQKSTTKVKSFL